MFQLFFLCLLSLQTPDFQITIQGFSSGYEAIEARLIELQSHKYITKEEYTKVGKDLWELTSTITAFQVTQGIGSWPSRALKQKMERTTQAYLRLKKKFEKQKPRGPTTRAISFCSPISIIV